MKKIGILGGTFNPIHHGHLILGQAAKEEFGLDEILVMPTKNPAYKTISGGVSEKNRVDMIKLAIRDFPYFKFSDIELKREGTTYTVDTLRELTKQDTDITSSWEQIRFIRSRHGKIQDRFLPWQIY